VFSDARRRAGLISEFLKIVFSTSVSTLPFNSLPDAIRTLPETVRRCHSRAGGLAATITP
jgi:hypothetical protein